MICPECGKDAGEAKFCPECGKNLSAPSENETKTEIVQENKTVETEAETKKRNKTIWIILAIIVAVVAFFGIQKVAQNAKPAEPLNWATVFSDYKNNGQTAKKRYENKEYKLYVRVDEINSTADACASVTLFDDNWEEVPFEVDFAKVFFKDYAMLQQGEYYSIKGSLTQFTINSSFENRVAFIKIKNAKVTQVFSEKQ